MSIGTASKQGAVEDVPLYPDFFNDVFGPIMQPGSSGSFAGTSRVGRMARHTLRSAPRRATIIFNKRDNRLASLGNMMDDRGFLGGLQDFATDDVRLFDAHELARKAGISYRFIEREGEGAPQRGYVRFELEGKDGDTSVFEGASIGGGMVRSAILDGFEAAWQADTYALLAWGPAGSETEEALQRVQTELGERLGDSLVRQAVLSDGQRQGVLLEYDHDVTADAGAVLGPRDGSSGEGLEWRLLPALLPVVTTRARQPQLFRTVQEWREAADGLGVSFVQAAIEYEKRFSGWSEEQIWDRFELIAQTLHNQIHSLDDRVDDASLDTPNLPVYGRWWDAYKKKATPLEDPLAVDIITKALSVNAKLPGTKIVPGPMGTGGGYLMSALEAVADARGFSHQKVLEGLVVAAGLGAIAFSRTHASGAAGCVGESGVCCAMASGAVTWAAGGDGVAVEHAASMALQANEGLPCDPIPGGKEFPCITRTVRAALTAPLYADLALAGVDPLIPYHEVLDAIEHNYQVTPAERLCGPTCGINCVPSACALQRHLSQDLMEGKLSFEADVETDGAAG